LIEIEKEKCLPQPVVTVEMNVKYHSSQKMTDLYIVENVSKIINPHNVVVALDMAEDLVMVEMTEVPGLVEVQEITDQEKCLPQPVVTVEMNVKYHSSQKMIDLFIAKNVSKIINKISKLFRVTL
jgi:acyl-coenzyme A thioesterase PaaI-like protein